MSSLRVSPPHPDLDVLLDRARQHVMTPAEIWDQRISWVYGNVGLENASITREMVEAAATREYGPRPA